MTINCYGTHHGPAAGRYTLQIMIQESELLLSEMIGYMINTTTESTPHQRFGMFN